MFLAELAVALLGTSVVRGLRVPTSRISARDSVHKPGGSFTVTRPGTNTLLSATVHATTTGSDDNDISSVRDIVYMASVTVAGKGEYPNYPHRE